MLNWLKLVILVILGGCCSDQPVTNCNHLDNAPYDPFGFPKSKKLFEIKIK